MAYRYPTCKVNGKTVLKHRHVMEQHLGRPLRPDEHVHHKNGDPFDWRIENLELLSAKDHMHHHKQKHPCEKECVVCGSPFTPHPTKRKRAKTCSTPCAYRLRWQNRKAAAVARAQFETSPVARAA